MTLNSLEYVVSGASDINEQPASEFAVTVAQGPPSYDTRENLSYWTMASWEPGLGKKFGLFRDDQGRFWMSNADTRFPNQLKLGPLVNTLGTFTTTNTIKTTSRGSIASFKSSDYFGLEERVYQNVAGTLTSRLSNGTGSHSQLMVYINSTGVEKLFAFTASANRIQYSTDGTAWTQANAGVIGRFGFEYDRNLVVLDGVANVGAIAATTVADNLAASYTTYANFRTGNTAIIAGCVYRNEAGDLVPFFAIADTTGGSNSGLWWMDFYSRKSFPVPISRRPARSLAQNESFFGMTVWNQDLYLPDRAALLTYGTDGKVKDVSTTANGGQGVPAGYGPYGYLAGQRAFMFMSMGSGTTYAIAALGQAGTHFLALRTSPIRALALSLLTSPTRLYWIEADDNATTATVYYIDLPVGSDNPINDPTYKYATTSYLITPWMDGGFADLRKILLRFRIRAENLTATETVVIEYQVDETGADSGPWLNPSTGTAGVTAANTFSDPSQVIRFGPLKQGTTARSFRFRITLARGATNTLSPWVRAITLDYLVTPDYRAADQFIIDLGATVHHRGEPYTTIATLITELITAYNSTTLISYGLGKDTQTMVKLASVKLSQGDLNMPDPQTGAARNGYAACQVIAVLA